MRRRVAGWAGLMVVALLPAGAPADVEQALEVLRLPYEEFALLPHEGPFDWSTDGCSVPLRATPGTELFEPACRLHDFGYRNLGGSGLGLRPTEAARRWVDGRFHAEMVRLCTSSGGRRAFRAVAACLHVAAAWYLVVRRSGVAWFR